MSCEDKILNATETSLDDKKVTCKENNCLIHTILLVVKCLLLLAVITQEIELRKNKYYQINI